MRRRASALMEYAIILGVVGAALITMNIYIKRGVQGRVKDMADYFINDGQEAQVVEIDPEVETTSESSVVSDSTLTDNTSLGGGKQLALLDNTSIEASSVTRDVGRSPNNPDTNTFIPAEAGQIDNLTRPNDSDFIDPEILAECGEACSGIDPNFESNWRNSVDIAYLTRERDRYLAMAKRIDSVAATLEANGRQLSRQASHMSCHGNHTCRNARAQLAKTAADMLNQAAMLRQEAVRARAEAALIQDKIDSLGG